MLTPVPTASRIADVPGLPLGVLSLARSVVQRRDATADHLLLLADACREAAATLAHTGQMDTACAYTALAERLGDLAPSYADQQIGGALSCR